MVSGDMDSAAGNLSVCRMDPNDIINLAEKFVIQYYTVMREQPAQLHRFYKDDSAMIRENATVFGQKLIHQNIMNANIHDSRVGILRLDALRANGNSVLIQVAGEISLNKGPARRFMQSFVLREQALYDFYVLNDIFRYQDHVYGDALNDDSTENATACESPDQFRNDIPVQPQRASSEKVRMNVWEDNRTDDLVDMKSPNSPRMPYEVTSKEIGSFDTRKQDQHTVIQETQPPTNMQTSPIEPEPQSPPAAQNFSWAQILAKQPGPGAATSQVTKTQRTAATAIVSKPDEQAKVVRSPLTTGPNSAAARARGGAGRPQIASADQNYARDSRATGQGAPRGRGGPSGGSARGSRGGRGGAFTGRGGASFPRRGGGNAQ